VSQSLFHRLRHTPLSHLVRGRISAALDWRARIADADLPEPVRGVVRDLCRRTRLWRREKAEVAGELIAHFHDGLDAGQTPDELVDRFGDVKPAAQLIRRAKRRCRPLGWQVRHRLRQGIAIFIGVYVLAALWLATGRPEPSVDYLARIRAPFADTNATDAAWPMYRDLKIDHQVWDGEAFLRPIDESVWGISPYDIDFGHPRIDDLANGVAAYDGYLATLRRIAAMPTMGMTLTYAESLDRRDLLALHGPDAIPDLPGMPDEGRPSVSRLLMSRLDPVVFPWLGQTRRDARLLHADLQVAVHRGDAERALANLTAIAGLVRLTAEGPTLIEDLTALGLLSMVTSDAAAVLWDRPELFDDAQLHRLSGVIASAADDVTLDLTAERYAVYDSLQHMFDPQTGQITIEGVRYFSSLADHRLVEPGIGERRELAARASTIGMPIAAAMTADHDAMKAEFDRLWALMDDETTALRPPDEASPFEREVETLLESRWWVARHWPLAVIAPSFGRGYESAAMLNTLADALQLAIALELHRRDHGNYPHEPNALIPDYIAALPPDPTNLGQDGQSQSSLKVTYRDGTPVIYGLGWDGDDDGGTPPEPYRWPNPDETVQDGDWVLFPVIDDDD